MSENHTADELSAKINAIKTERERTANALKRYEEELECMKQEVPLGVPSKFKSNMYYFLTSKNEVVCPTIFDNKSDGLDRQLAFNVFEIYESAEKHAEMLLDWRKALVANAKGEQIDIQVLLPLLRKGWAAMDGRNNEWFWYKSKPEIGDGIWKDACNQTLSAFNIKPAKDWRESLRECGL